MHSIQIVQCIASFAFDFCTCLMVISSHSSPLNPGLTPKGVQPFRLHPILPTLLGCSLVVRQRLPHQRVGQNCIQPSTCAAGRL